MPREIVIKRGTFVTTLATVLAVLAGLGALLLVQNLPEIRREVKIWMM